MTDAIATTDPTDEDVFEGIPDTLRFDVSPRPEPEDRADAEQVKFAVGDAVLLATKPLDYTMLMLGAAMSGMADGPDRAYAIMTFCHDTFDAATREVVKQLPGDGLMDIIEALCLHWGQDTSTWQREPANRETRRAAAKKKPRK